jgi:DNA-directed RNA polymerase specialized sigma24 family protein
MGRVAGYVPADFLIQYASRERSHARVPGSILGAVKSDRDVWNEIVDRYAPLIWSICRKHRLAAADTQDVSQKVWLHLLDKFDNLRDPAALPAWIATTTRRECLQVLKEHKSE